MARPKSKIAVDEVALNLFIPRKLAEELDVYLRTGPGASRPKKLIVGTAIMRLLGSNEEDLNKAVRRFQTQYLQPRQVGGEPATADVQARPVETTPSRGSRRAG